MSDTPLPPPLNELPHQPRFGLVCITHSPVVRYRTLTLSRYQTIPEKERPRVLDELYRHNLQILMRALAFCHARGIGLYRVTSALFPLSDLVDGVGQEVLENLKLDLLWVGRQAAKLGIRVVVHPDQFVVLSSDNCRVVENSIAILEHQADLFDRMGLPHSPWAAINIHGGKRDKAEQLVEVIGQLHPSVRSRLTLENDERAYGAEAILEICQQTGLPMIFDVHHHVVKERLSSLEDPSIGHLVRQAQDTWPQPEWQIVHLSNGRSGLHDVAHHDLVVDVPSAYRGVPWIEVEAKRKEAAIEWIQTNWNVLTVCPTAIPARLGAA